MVSNKKDWSKTATSLSSEATAALNVIEAVQAKGKNSTSKVEAAQEAPVGSPSTSRTSKLRRKRRDLEAKRRNSTGSLKVPSDAEKQTIPASPTATTITKKTNGKSPDKSHPSDTPNKAEDKSIVETFLNNKNNKPKKEPKNAKRLDEYGFIVNLDCSGQIRDENFVDLPGGASTPSDRKPSLSPPPRRVMRPKRRSKGSKKLSAKQKRQRQRLMQRREKKWVAMLDDWSSLTLSAAKRTKLRNRIRKGIPNAVRGQAWCKLRNIPEKIEVEQVGVYAELVMRSSGNPSEGVDGNGTVAVQNREGSVEIFDMENYMKDTIERDINRTFPRHNMFYDSASESSSDEEDADDQSYDVVSFKESPSTSIYEDILEMSSKDISHDGIEIGDEGQEWENNSMGITEATSTVSKCKKKKGKKEVDFTVAKGGQASLRRVLRAYSIYDVDVGYCQGMNFIAAMFITYMDEEEAFWLLVAVMNDKPCRMRGLFREGMSEAHQVLYVAEKLIAQFNPKLSRHLEKENVHITMFATQWLLTLYTSSFPFDVVTRVWDCFLAEGWKIVYRVMLVLLEQSTPKVLKMRFEEILGHFKEMVNKIDGNTLMEAAFKIPLKRKHIEKYAKAWIASQKKT